MSDIIVATIAGLSAFLISKQIKENKGEQTGGTLISDPLNQPVASRRLLEPTVAAALNLAIKLKELLYKYDLNIITAESLTAGMITKTLVDVPGEGAVVYGGYIVYDTDAKRQMINVSTEGVYSLKTADQMARGALLNSRAMVSLAVTGNAMPYPDHKDFMGEVFIGIAIRMKTKIMVETKRVNICDHPNVEKTCNDWKNLSISEYPNIPSYQHTSMLADYVRQATVVEALNFTLETLNKIINTQQDDFGYLEYQEYDSVCKPSLIIEERIKDSNKYNMSNECDGRDEISFSNKNIKRNKNEWAAENALF